VLLQAALFNKGVEERPLAAALRAVLAEDVTAAYNIPPFRASTMVCVHRGDARSLSARAWVREGRLRGAVE
jgi:hypothetical protein